MQINLALAERVLEVVDAGLTWGMGDPKPGHMCVEAAVCYALGEPHRDKPSCVAGAVQSFKITLNDGGPWTDAYDRARALRAIAIAQLGSNQIDEDGWSEYVVLEIVRTIGADRAASEGWRHHSADALREITLEELHKRSAGEWHNPLAGLAFYLGDHDKRFITRPGYAAMLAFGGLASKKRAYTERAIQIGIDGLRKFGCPGVELMDQLIK